MGGEEGMDGRSEDKGQSLLHPAITAKGKSQRLSLTDTDWISGPVLFIRAPSSSAVHQTTRGDCKETWNRKLPIGTQHMLLPTTPPISSHSLSLGVGHFPTAPSEAESSV